MIPKIWECISSVRTTLWLILAAIALLLTGSVYVRSNAMGFHPLNHSLMQDWFREWGLRNLDQSWWFPVLAAILLLLGINTLCCVLDRLVFHWRRRRLTGTNVFLVKILPTLIHLTFALMLAGHLCSMGVGFRSRDMEFVSRPGETGLYALPGNVAMEVGEPLCEFYSGPFAGRIRQCRIRLRFTARGGSATEEVALAEPLLWNGYQIHMSQVFGEGQFEAYSVPDFQLLVKRDPGLRILMICFPVLILLTLLFYIGDRTVRKTRAFPSESDTA